MTNFCQYCKVLQFDDSLCGGHVGRSDTNEAVLAFADDQICEYENEEGARERVVELYYDRQDMLPDMPGLEETAAAGCQFCPFLRRGILGSIRHEISEAMNGSLRILYAYYVWIQTTQDSGPPPRSWNLELRFIIDLENSNREADVSFRVCAPPGSIAMWLEISPMPHPNDIWTPEKISWINESISKCVESCDHEQSSDPLPTRLIHVGDRTGNKFGNPRLVITTRQEALMETPPKYVTLSYCWGDSAASTLKTERANLEDHLKEIRLENMAATCRDAVLVTRAIGVNWLWIDALCILQDDKEDWEKEASRMAEVYGRAFLTIVPLRSQSSSDGFLTQRESIDYVEVFFNSVVDPTVHGVFTVRNTSPKHRANIVDAIIDEVLHSEWCQRGWTFQESAMSFRKLYFGDCGVYFGCENMTIRENGESVPYHHHETGEWVNEIRLNRDKENVLFQYYSQITRYSGRSLTFQKDILPSFAAIAKVFSDNMGDEYLCGLWRTDLLKGMSWIMQRDSLKLKYEKHIDKISSLKDYIGPSWSWTSPVSKQQYIEWWGGLTVIAACDIIEAESVAEGKNRFGCVRSAHILIRGRSRPLPGPSLYVKVYSGVRFWTAVENGHFTAKCELDWYANEGLEDVMEEEQEEDDDKEYPRQRILTAASASWLNDLVMLLVGQDSKDKTMNGLLLVRAEKENEWYRVGVFHKLSGEKEGEDPLQNWETRTFKLV